jgi:threonine dehydratase
LRQSSWLSDSLGADVRLKLETQQPTSSYKVRGAINAVLHLIEAPGGAPAALVTASAGNHGRALAWAVGAGGIPLTVYAPAGAPRTKLEAIRMSGATLVACDTYDAAERQAKEHAEREGVLYVSPYSHPDVIAGAGTVGLEILDEWPEVDIVVVPIGGGGLISGIAMAVRGASRTTVVVGVEVAASSPFTKGIEAGRIVTIDVQPTLADGLAGNLDPDTVTFDIVRQNVSRIVLVEEGELRSAIVGLLDREHVIAEGAGAVGVAAILSRAIDIQGKRVAVVVSGGNIDNDKLSALRRPPSAESDP